MYAKNDNIKKAQPVLADDLVFYGSLLWAFDGKRADRYVFFGKALEVSLLPNLMRATSLRLMHKATR